MSEALLELDGLSKAFGAHQVLDGVTARIRPGEIVGLLGPNGSGKSTLLNAISGFLPPDAGRVTIAGTDITARPAHVVPRVGRRTGRDDRIDALLEMFRLAHVADLPASSLSGGQKKLLSVALALRGSPRLLCLDEPTAGVHPELRTEMVRILKQAAGEGTTLLVIEHDMLFIRQLCSRCIVLDRGHLIADCAPDELEHNGAVVEAYLGKAVQKGKTAR